MLVHSHSKWQHLAVGVVLSLCLAGSVYAQQPPPANPSISDSESQTNLGGTNSIIGTVFAPSGRPIESRVRVKLSTMTRGDRIFQTNQNGGFAFRGLPAGSYTVIIEKEADYNPASQTVDIIQFRNTPGQTYTVNIRLQFKDRTEVKPAVVSAELLNVPKKALTHFETAMELAKKNEHQGAIDELKLAIAEYPTFTRAFNELGVQYLKLNKLEEANEAFLGALKINPASFPALINRGIVNVMMKRYGEAVPILRKALQNHEQSAVGHYFLGQALANLGLFDDAEKDLLKALELGKEDMKEAHRILAIIYSAKGSKKRAADELEAYLKLAPTTPDAEKLKDQIRKLRESGQ
jgi:tetratricopeptide (TPR) repeat protein